MKPQIWLANVANISRYGQIMSNPHLIIKPPFASYLPTIPGWCFQPLWKIWLRQLGWWHSQYMESQKKHVPNHQPAHDKCLQWTHDLPWKSQPSIVPFRLAARIARRDLIGLCVRDLQRAQPGPGPGVPIQAQIRVSQPVFQQFKLTISDNGEARSAGFQKKLMLSKHFWRTTL